VAVLSELGDFLEGERQPMMGWTPAPEGYCENSSAPNRLLVSVRRSPAPIVGLRELRQPRDRQRAFEQRIGRMHPKMHERWRVLAHASLVPGFVMLGNRRGRSGSFYPRISLAVLALFSSCHIMAGLAPGHPRL
jgi:hypothetical protein